jgi:hypothetical protein
MQNAQRAKQQAAVELEKAKVRDEAQWEVAKEVREAWGLTNTKSECGRSPVLFMFKSLQGPSRQTVTYEASYLPFLFPSSGQSSDLSPEQNVAGPSSQARVSGRRTFGKGGKEFTIVRPNIFLRLSSS